MIQTAESGEAGLALYVKSRFDLVITELRMTGMDGIALLLQLREWDSRTRVLVLTAYPTTDSVKEALNSGAVDYLEKPCEKDQLFPVIRSILKAKAVRKYF